MATVKALVVAGGGGGGSDIGAGGGGGGVVLLLAKRAYDPDFTDRHSRERDDHGAGVQVLRFVHQHHDAGGADHCHWRLGGRRGGGRRGQTRVCRRAGYAEEDCRRPLAHRQRRAGVVPGQQRGRRHRVLRG